ncbi:MAG: DUF1186 family protein, partial [Oscillospiraceae bacterium]|nr:DUF1186 family protein [Oscillospiraceae bacterium]
MDVKQALNNIKIITSELAEEEILCIRQHKDEAIPVLLDYIRTVTDLGNALPVDYCAHYYAMYLLAEFKVRDALPYLLGFLEFDRHLTDNILEDILTEDFGSILASIATIDDMPVIESVIENGNLDSFNRGAALNSFKVFYTQEVIGRDKYHSYLRHLLETCQSDPEFLGDVIYDCVDSCFSDLLSLIEILYKRKLVDTQMISFKEVKHDLSGSDEATALQNLKQNNHNQFVADAIESVRWLIPSENNPDFDQYSLLEKSIAFNNRGKPIQGIDAFLQYIRNNTSQLPKKQQLSASELMEQFKKEAQRMIPKSGIAYCERLISQGLSDTQISNAVTAYIKNQRSSWGFDITATTALVEYMMNYITVTDGLLLSYTMQKDGRVHQIPESFYKSTPRDFARTLVAIPYHNIIISAYWCADEAWYGSQQGKTGALLTIKIYRKERTWQLLCDGSFIDTHHPRFSLSCVASPECALYSESSLTFSMLGGNSKIFGSECKLGPNRSRICVYEKELTNKFGVGLSGFLAILLMCHNRWRNRPMRIGTKKSESYSGEGIAYIANTA